MAAWLFDFIHLGEEWWGQSKSFIERLVGVGNDALHLLVGALLVFAFAAIMRSSVRDIRPGLLVLLLALLNEWHDLRAETWPDRSMQYGEGVKDVILTIAVPALLLVLARWCPGLFGPAKSRQEAPGQDSSDG